MRPRGRGLGSVHKFACLSPRESFFTAVRRASTIREERGGGPTATRRVYYPWSPHGVAHNNHRRLLRGYGSNLRAPISLYIVSVWNGSIGWPPGNYLPFRIFIFSSLLLVPAEAFKNFLRKLLENQHIFDWSICYSLSFPRFHSLFKIVRGNFSLEGEREKFLINWRFERHLLAKDERERKERRRGGYFRRKRRR